MERGLYPLATELRRGPGVQQSETNVLCPKARGTDQRCLALPVFAKVNGRACLKENIDERQLPSFLQYSVEQHIRHVVEWMREHAVIVAPMDEGVRSRPIQCKTPAQGGGVAVLDRSLHVEVVGHSSSSAMMVASIVATTA